MKTRLLPGGALRRGGVLAIVATILALFFATKDSFHQLALGYPITWRKSLWWKAMEWYAWAAFSPLIFRLCRRFDFSTRLARTVLAHLAGGAVASVLHCCVLTTGARIEAQVLQTGQTWPELFKYIFTNHFHEDVLTYAAIVSAWYALDYHNRFKERARRAAELEAHLAQARLQSLKSQLHPHFLFNTLNGIAALIYDNPKAAHRMLATLSELLRMSLKDEGEQKVLFQSELDFCRRYLELEQIRFGPRLSIDWDITPETLEARVPNLLLQPLLENSIKHGIAPFSTPGHITIFSRRENDRLLVRVTDNGPGLLELNNLTKQPGIGLRNTQARLQALYGNQHRIEFKRPGGGGFIVEIAIPFATQTALADTHHEDSHVNCG
jgi:two-component system LytT family sensor kinase